MKFDFPNSKQIREKNSGRGSSGSIISRFKGKGSKSKKYYLDLRRQLRNREGIIIGFEQDSKRSRKCKLALVYLKDLGIFTYILASTNSYTWDEIQFIGDIEQSNIKDGSSGYLKNFRNNTKIFNVELYRNCGGQLARAGGTYIRILRRYFTNKGSSIVRIELPSGRSGIISGWCYGTKGIASGVLSITNKYSKAGDSRHRGIRPRVRGVAMNPVDHPHGGGEGKTSGGRVSVSAWGILSKGWRTNRSKLQRKKYKNSKILKKKKNNV